MSAVHMAYSAIGRRRVCAGGEPRTLCEVLSHVEPHVQHTPAFVITFVLKVAVILSA